MSYRRVSRYYPGEDGTLLAVDVYLPDVTEKVPFLLMAGYEKRRIQFDREKAALEKFLQEGYAIVIVDVRGSGASYGVSDGFFGVHDGKDLKCIMEALAREPWCSGVCGTYGGSNYGMSQEITAVTQPKPLRAVIPCDCSMDLYDQNYPNGVSAIPDMPAPHDSPAEQVSDPVDDDPEGIQAAEAAACHARNLRFLGQYLPNMFRDDVNPQVGYAPNLAVPAWEKMDAMRFGHVKNWSLGAWFDPGCTNKILTFKSWGGRLTLGPWPHCGVYRSANYGLPGADYDWFDGHLKYFDKYVKGKDNGFENQPPVEYYTIGEGWKYEEDFPVEGTMFSRFHLGADGKLTCIDAAPGSRDYQVRNDVMIYDKFMRMDRNVQKDMTPEDEKSLVFTSDELPADAEITGIPVLDLFVSSTYKDGNFIAVLEEVTPDGVSHFLTEGAGRASHAKTQMNPVYASMGLPYHRGFKADAVEMPLTKDVRAGVSGSAAGADSAAAGAFDGSAQGAAPLKLSFHLEATSRIVKKGSRLRIAISCGGSGYGQPKGFPEEMPTITLYSGKETDSCLTLPLIKAQAVHFVVEDGASEGAAAQAAGTAKGAGAMPVEKADAAGADAAGTEVWVFKTALYTRKNGVFKRFPVKQVYPLGKVGEKKFAYVCESVRAVVCYKDDKAELELCFTQKTAAEKGFGAESETAAGFGAENGAASGDSVGCVLKASAALPERFVPENASPEIPREKNPWAYYPEVTCKDLYVATAPVPMGAPGNMNPMMRKSFDIFIDLILPKEGKKPYPVIVNIHGFGGDHHQFERNTDDFLKLGYAVASVDYRLTPPCTWEAPVYDAKACIRYLKAHAEEFGLDGQRIGIQGGSMGGYLTGFIAASNGESSVEGDIGGNTEFDSSVLASATAYGPMELLTFGDDCEKIWPGRPEKRANGDGPFAPPASMIGYVGYGKGVADLKNHLSDPDPMYQGLLQELWEASPISHVTENSAPICLVHGIFDCGIQVPMGQSVRMFEAYSQKGVKALLLCNNNGLYGEDPEVKEAVIRFLNARV